MCGVFELLVHRFGACLDFDFATIYEISFSIGGLFFIVFAEISWSFNLQPVLLKVCFCLRYHQIHEIYLSLSHIQTSYFLTINSYYSSDSSHHSRFLSTHSFSQLTLSFNSFHLQLIMFHYFWLWFDHAANLRHIPLPLIHLPFSALNKTLIAKGIGT